MIEPLLHYMRELPQASAGTVLLEDMALASAWLHSLQDSAEQDEWSFIAELGDAWSRAKPPVCRQTEGQRLQPLLRMVIDHLLNDGPQALGWGEIQFLVQAHDLASASLGSELFERPRQLIGDHIEPLRQNGASIPPDAELTMFPFFLEYAGTDTIERAPSREFSHFAGIELSHRGPLLQGARSLKIYGDVPDGCTVVIPNGSCYVTGFVLGNVACASGCEVRENISGVVVARDENVRARGLVNQARVVAKSGSVFCCTAQSPSLVFARKELFVRDDVRQGHYVGRKIHVGGRIGAGTFEVTRSLKSALFAEQGNQPIIAVLRHDLMCNDYGRPLSRDVQQAVARIRKLQFEASLTHRLRRAADSELNHYATNLLFYLCSDNSAENTVRVMEAALKRLTCLDNVVAGLDALRSLAEDRVALECASLDVRPSSRVLANVESSLALVERELPKDDILEEGRDALRHLAGELSSSSPSKPAADLLADCVVLHADWTAKRDDLAAKLQQKEKGLLTVAGDVLEQGTSQTSTPLVILASVLSRAKDNTLPQSVRNQLASSFGKLMLRKITVKRKHLKELEQTAREAFHTAAQLSADLEESHNYFVDTLGGVSDDGPIISGVFETPVTLCTELALLSKTPPPPGLVVHVDVRGSHTYKRGVHGIIETTGTD